MTVNIFKIYLFVERRPIYLRTLSTKAYMYLRNAPPAARTSYMSLSAARAPGGCAITSLLGGSDELRNDESGEERRGE